MSLVAQARSQWPATIAISLRVFHVCSGSSPLRRAANASNMPVICRANSTSIFRISPHLPRSPKSAKSQSLSAQTPELSKPAKDNPLSAESCLSLDPQKEKTKLTPEVVIYHNPELAASVKFLKLLQRAQSAYPRTKRHTGPPLDFKLNVLVRLPTIEELQDMYSLLNESSWTIFRARNTISNYRHHPTSARSLLNLIDHERQEEIAKAKQKTQDNAVVTVPPATDSFTIEQTAPELPAEELPILDADHPLFGTHTFPWPVMVCWDAKTVMVGSRSRLKMKRLLKDFANERDNIIVQTEEQIKEEEERIRQANWTYPKKEESPDEDDALKWFNESHKKPTKKPSW